jgi:hypothetical protein
MCSFLITTAKVFVLNLKKLVIFSLFIHLVGQFNKTRHVNICSFEEKNKLKLIKPLYTSDFNFILFWWLKFRIRT